MTIEASKLLLDGALASLKARSRELRELRRIGLFTTRWYPETILALKNSALELFRTLDIPRDLIEDVEVSGSWEIPLIVREFVSRRKPDLVVVLGCIVRGETPHFDILCQTVSRELMNLQVTERLPLGFGILTLNKIEEAYPRKLKGAEAAEAALRSWIEMRKFAR